MICIWVEVLGGELESQFCLVAKVRYYAYDIFVFELACVQRFVHLHLPQRLLVWIDGDGRTVQVVQTVVVVVFELIIWKAE